MDESNYEKPYIKNGNSVTAQVERCRYTDFGWIQLDLVGTEPSGMRCLHSIDLPPEFGLEPFQPGRTVCVTKTHGDYGCTFKVEFEHAPPTEVFCEY